MAVHTTTGSRKAEGGVLFRSENCMYEGHEKRLAEKRDLSHLFRSVVALAKLKNHNPDLRITQLIANALRARFGEHVRDYFYLEDDDFATALEAYAEAVVNSTTQRGEEPPTKEGG